MLILTLSLCLSRWLTAPVGTASTTCGAGRWSAAPADFLQTNPAAARWAQPPARSAAEASPRVYCRTPTCSAPVPLARWAPIYDLLWIFLKAKSETNKTSRHKTVNMTFFLSLFWICVWWLKLCVLSGRIRNGELSNHVSLWILKHFNYSSSI